ncbi:hypothetical protein D1007_51421 [Hordeum vulgare]|nr:hypothetical protein D1007_51421 [Hordeum vulgare]
MCALGGRPRGALRKSPATFSDQHLARRGPREGQTLGTWWGASLGPQHAPGPRTQAGRLGIESPFDLPDAGYAEFSYELVKELEGATKKVDIILEEGCRDLFSMVVTHVFSHLLLCDPHYKFEEVMGPVPEEPHDKLATAMEGHVHTLLGKFFCNDDE